MSSTSSDYSWHGHDAIETPTVTVSHYDSDAEEKELSSSNDESQEDLGISSSGNESGDLRKRKYNHITRIKNPRQKSGMRVRWADEVSTMTDSEIKIRKCCKTLKCFTHCNIPFLRQKMTLYRSMSSMERRQQLSTMKGSNGKFIFDGNYVCSSFLLQAFRYSRDMQADVKSDSMAPTTTTLQAGSTSFPISFTARASPQKESIICFLQRISEKTGEKMPDTGQSHLPFFQKRHVYNIFTEEFLSTGTGTAPTFDYFVRIWKHSCSDIKIRKQSRFAKCDICEDLRHALRKAISEHADTTELIRRKNAHTSMVMSERLEYRKNRESAILNPDEYCSAIVDGADQSAFGLPHFVTQRKSQTGHSIKVRLIGVLEHAATNRLRLLTMTEDHESGANHIVESIHRFINDRVKKNGPPLKLFLQMDNCTRENKNRYLFSYLECLVIWNVFSEIQVGFLPVGHTHEDIDQSFSRTSQRLRSNDAITLTDLHAELRQTYNRETTVAHMEHVGNWSGLCELERCLRKVQPFTHYRYFRFCRACSTTETNMSQKQTFCMVRTSVNSDWKHLHTDRAGNPVGFIRFAPDLSKTPPTTISTPENVLDVTKRLECEEDRINSTRKLSDLYKLRDHVYRTRQEIFHWDLSYSLEHTATNALQENEVEESEATDDTNSNINVDSVTNDYMYETDSFVLVRPEADEQQSNIPFWLGRIQNTLKNSNGVESILTVHWYELHNSNDMLEGKYCPSYISLAKGRKKPWKDDISTDTVVINFPNLTKKMVLPASVRRQLQHELSTRS